MNHFQLDSRIDAPVEHVWAFLCDTSHWHEWDPRTEYSDWSGPVDRVGTTFVATSRTMGFEMKGTTKVVQVEPLRLLRFLSDLGPTWVFRFEPEGKATRLTFETDYEMPGHIPGFIKNVMTKSWVERDMRHQLEDFKALAEATVPVPA
jgi:ligand-binding SRPBCC domain-containing protein